jgi:hypothetical protein
MAIFKAGLFLAALIAAKTPAAPPPIIKTSKLLFIKAKLHKIFTHYAKPNHLKM